MAKVVFGGLVSEVRGTLGDDVYTRTKSGGIVRKKTDHEWVFSDLRGFACDALQLALAAWYTELSQAQRDAWNSFATVQTRAATSIARTQLSGQMWFLKLNVPLYWIEATPIFDPPGNLAATQPTNFTIHHIATNNQQFILQWQPPLPPNYLARIKASDSMSVGISSWLKQIGWAGDESGEALATANIWDDYVTYHPTPIVGLKIGAVIRFLNIANGMNSRPLRADAIVQQFYPPMPVITGRQLWLQADTLAGLVDGDPVTTWPDSGTSGHNATADGALRPTYKTGILDGKPVVRFNGANSMATTAFTFNQPVTIFVVGNMTDEANRVFTDGTPHYTRLLGGNTHAVLYSYAGGTITQAVDNMADHAVIGAVFKGTDSLTSYNGTVQTGNAGTDASAGIIVGSTSDPSAFLLGDIAEMVAYDTALSETDRQNVEGYLAWKWGLQALLPTGHPWK